MNLPETEPVIAFLIIAGVPRQTCLGCSQLLRDKGMLDVLHELAVNVDNRDGPVPTAITYVISEAFTLDDCREVIKGRHVGKPWGA